MTTVSINHRWHKLLTFLKLQCNNTEKTTFSSIDLNLKQFVFRLTNRCSFVSTLTLLQYFLNAFSIFSGLDLSASVNESANVLTVLIQTEKFEKKSIFIVVVVVLPSQCCSSNFFDWTMEKVITRNAKQRKKEIRESMVRRFCSFLTMKFK